MLDQFITAAESVEFWGPLSALLLTSLALMGSPGPATISVAATAAAFGPKRAVRYMLGIILRTTSVLVIVASGLTGTVFAIPGAQPILIGAAALYILYLAYRIATAPPIVANGADTRPPSVAGGFFLAIANPKAYAAIGAVFASITVFEQSLAGDAVFKVVVLAIMVALINLVWLFVGALLSHLMGHPVWARVINGLFAAVLVFAMVVALLA